MARPVKQHFDVATVVLGPQAPVNLDYLPLTQTTVAVYLTTGTASFGVEYTLDDLNDPTVTNPQWFASKEIPAGTAATTYGAFWQPWRFVRINIAALTGTLDFYISQSFITGPRG